MLRFLESQIQRENTKHTLVFPLITVQPKCSWYQKVGILPSVLFGLSYILSLTPSFFNTGMIDFCRLSTLWWAITAAQDYCTLNPVSDLACYS